MIRVKDSNIIQTLYFTIQMWGLQKSTSWDFLGERAYRTSKRQQLYTHGNAYKVYRLDSRRRDTDFASRCGAAIYEYAEFPQLFSTQLCLVDVDVTYKRDQIIQIVVGRHSDQHDDQYFIDIIQYVLNNYF